MKTLTLLLFSIAILSTQAYAQGEMGASELLIKNRMLQIHGDLKVRIYPIGTFFRTVNTLNQYMEYSPLADRNDHPIGKQFITGGEKLITPYIPGTPFNRDNVFRIDQVGASDAAGCDITVGYGLYQVDIMYWDSTDWNIISSFTIDWSDSGYPNEYTSPPELDADIKVYVLDSHPDSVRFHFGGGNTEPFENYRYDFHTLATLENRIEVWKQYHKDIFGKDTIYSRIPNKNGFRTTDTLQNLFLRAWPMLGSEFQNPD